MSKSIVWLVWDAASMDIVEKFIEEGLLPNLSKVMKKGIGLRMRLEQLNCQTPAALAVLFTGMPSDENYITGFYTPDISMDKNLLSRKSSFHQNGVHKHSIWNWAVSNGKTVSLVHVPFVEIVNGKERPYYRIAIDGYKNRVSRGKVLMSSSMEWSRIEACNSRESFVTVEGFRFNIQLYYKYQKQRAVIICLDGSPRQQKVDLEIGEVLIDKNHSFTFREGTKMSVSAVYNADDRSEILFVFSGVYKVIDHAGRNIESLLNYAGIFEGEGYGRYYRRGLFGIELLQPEFPIKISVDGFENRFGYHYTNKSCISRTYAMQFCRKNGLITFPCIRYN